MLMIWSLPKVTRYFSVFAMLAHEKLDMTTQARLAKAAWHPSVGLAFSFACPEANFSHNTHWQIQWQPCAKTNFLDKSFRQCIIF